MNTRNRGNAGLALALVAAPVLWLAAEAVSPPLKADSGDQLTVIAQHPDRWYGYTALLIIGTMLLLPALLGIARLTRDSAPLPTTIGSVLLGFGTLIAVGDAMSQLVTWQMVAAGADRAQMSALLDRVDNSAGAGLFFGVGGLAFVVGAALLAVALLRTNAVPAWAAVAFAAGMLVQLVGFTVNSVAVIAASSAALIAAMGTIARNLLTGSARPVAHDHAAPDSARQLAR